METTQEERDDLLAHLDPEHNNNGVICRAIRDADRLAAIERQVLWRTEDMPEDVYAWQKIVNEFGIFCEWCLTAEGYAEHETSVIDAPDYRPEESGPIWLPILDPEEQ